MDERETRYPRVDENETVADRPATVLENAMFELEMVQGELFEATNLLARKLERIMQRPYNPKESASLADMPSKDTERHSPLVRQLSSCAARTRSTREIVDYINGQLEV